MSKKLYLFDFDGTITHADSFKDFFFKMFGFRKVAWLLMINLGKILSILLTSSDKGKWKETLIAIFLKGKSKEELKTLGETYTKKHIYRIIRPKAYEFLQKLQKENAEMYLVSASIDFWLQPFADDFNMKLIATQLAYENDIFTGKFSGKNCKGAEKVHRIKQQIHIDDYDEIIAFGNSKGDAEMLAIATEAHYKPFTKDENL